MARDLMDVDELRQWVLRQLGAPRVKVELCVEHIQDAYDWAVRWFNAKKGIVKTAPLAIASGTVEYELAADVDTVIEVLFPAERLDLSLIFYPTYFSDIEVPYDVFASGKVAGVYSSYTQMMQYVEMAKRIMGAEVDWRQENRKLYIFPGTSENFRSGTALIVYKPDRVTIEQLNERDHDLIKRYALARAKQMLGRVRSKYEGGFPGAQGTITLDGQVLLEEARTDLELLEEEISLSGFPMGFMTG